MDIILLIFLAIHIGKLAKKKGLPPGRWRLYTVLAWLATEFAGIVLGLLMFGSGNILGLALFALVCGFGGYLLVHARISKYPDLPGNEGNWQ